MIFLKIYKCNIQKQNIILMTEQIQTIQTPFSVQSLEICGHWGNLGIKEEFMYGIYFLVIFMIFLITLLYTMFLNRVYSAFIQRPLYLTGSVLVSQSN